MSSLTAARQERIKELFAAAMSLPLAARGGMLDGACAGDTELRMAVRHLLDNYESAQKFFAQFPDDFARNVLGFAEVPRTFSPGDLVSGRFRIVGFLGAGGMGEVYEAKDLLLDVDHLALKTLPGHIAGNPAAVARLKGELALARQVTHVNVCRVFDVDEHVTASGVVVAFFTMELLRGETLSARLQRNGALTTVEARPLVAQMVAALGAAHTAGIVHGDFKPGNVILVPSPGGSERLVVTDFGLARLAPVNEPDRSDTNSRAVWGTPLYMAPEQFAGRRATRATDVYALAVVMLELLMGEQGIDLNTAISPSTPIDPGWRSAILRGLDHDPTARFPTVDALWTAITEADEPATSRRRWFWVAGVALSLVLPMSFPTIRDKVGATIVGGGTAPAETQQSVVVLASTGPDPRPDEEAFSRGLAAAVGEQIGAGNQPAAAFLFMPSGDMVDRGVNSTAEARRTLGADLIVTVFAHVVRRLRLRSKCIERRLNRR